jgi:hypothetical protein
MQLRDMVQELSNLVWEMERQTKQPMEDVIVTYVRDAVSTEMEYRRRMADLDRRMAELENLQQAAPAR